jgi:hypothetical protein
MIIKYSFQNKQPFVKLLLPESIFFYCGYNNYNYSNSQGTINNKYEFLNSSLVTVKKEAKMEYTLAATNLLNTKTMIPEIRLDIDHHNIWFNR